MCRTRNCNEAGPCDASPGEGRLANEPAQPLPPSEGDLSSEGDLDFDAKDHDNQQQEK